jgi:uncharacterized protein (DUF1919 family)
MGGDRRRGCRLGWAAGRVTALASAPEPDTAIAELANDAETLKTKLWRRLLAQRARALAPVYRRRLAGASFTVVSNDCWGAMVYEQLGIPYQTPFVGLFVMAPCFLRLLEDLEGYLGAPIEFVETSRYPALEQARRGADARRYPIGLLRGDVELHFVHYATAEEAEGKWTRRVARVDWDRLFVKLTGDKDLCDQACMRAFDRLSYADKVCFTARPWPGIESAVRIPGYVANGAHMYPASLLHFSVLRWLEGRSPRRRSVLVPLGRLLGLQS